MPSEPVPSDPVRLTRWQSRRIDAVAIEELKIPSLILMENAGRGAAEWIHSRYKPEIGSNSGAVWIVCGTGNNGGDGLVIARHLHNVGCEVRVWIVGDRSRMTRDASVNLRIAIAMALPIEDIADASFACGGFSRGDVIVDAMLGTGFSGDVREPTASLIRQINAIKSERVVAIDVPSGLDCDTGTVANVAVRANATVTFVAKKRGFDLPEAKQYLGEVVVAGIGTPPSLVDRISREPSGES